MLIHETSAPNGKANVNHTVSVFTTPVENVLQKKNAISVQLQGAKGAIIYLAVEDHSQN